MQLNVIVFQMLFQMEIINLNVNQDMKVMKKIIFVIVKELKLQIKQLEKKNVNKLNHVEILQKKKVNVINLNVIVLIILVLLMELINANVFLVMKVIIIQIHVLNLHQMEIKMMINVNVLQMVQFQLLKI